MSAPRIIPAGPMRHDDILPLIRQVSELYKSGDRDLAESLTERIRQPLTVGGQVVTVCLDGGFNWSNGASYIESTITLTAYADEWRVTLMANGPDVLHQCYGRGPTIAAALADAHARYQAAIGDTLLRMSGLLREVVS